MLHGQTIELEYSGELQTNFSGKYNFVNQLHFSVEKQVSNSFTLNLGTISTAKTCENILDDIQGFSNIEADNLPLALTVAGITWNINKYNNLFAGIRRVDEDYFTSDVLGLFTNSSCGIFPTLSCNYPVATFPEAGMAIHYRHEREQWAFQASLYNGTGHHKFTGKENVFRVCPASDGIMAWGQGEYHGKNGDYFAGMALHYGSLDESSTHKARTTVWAYCEQRLNPSVSIVASYSHAFHSSSPCIDFAGVGAMWQNDKIQVGVFSDVARFTDINEWATEVTCKYQINNNIALQPAIHYIHNSDSKVAGLMRVTVNL